MVGDFKFEFVVEPEYASTISLDAIFEISR